MILKRINKEYELNTLKLVVTTSDEWDVAKDYLESNVSREFAIDTETCPDISNIGTEREVGAALRDDSVMLGLSISNDEESGIFIPWFTGPDKKSYFPDLDLLSNMYNYLFDLLSSDKNKWIYHNALFDVKVLRRHITTPRNLYYDTQLAAHELDENRPLGLKPLGIQYFGIDADEEKRDMQAWCVANNVKFDMGRLDLLPLSIYGPYAIKDTMLTKGLKRKTYEELEAAGLVDRFKTKLARYPVYLELASTGWCIDDQIWKDNAVLVEKDILDVISKVKNLYPTEIDAMEKDIIMASSSIKKTPSMLKALIELEDLSSYFTEPTLTKTGKPNKNAGKFTTSAKFVESFLLLPEASGTYTQQFINWDGIDLRTLPAKCESVLDNYIRTKYLDNVRDKQIASGKIVTPTIFNLSSNSHIQDLIFNRLGLTPNKFTNSAKSKTWEYADVGIEAIDTLIMQHNKYMDDNPNDPPDKIEAIKKRVTLFELILKYRDLNKEYSTYLIGLQKNLYTAEQLNRKQEFSAVSGRPVKYLISSINPCGTKTGRPSSSAPNLLNISNAPRVKEAFVAPEGYVIVSADFAAQEVRETGNICNDPDLKEVFTCRCSNCGVEQPKGITKRIALDKEKLEYFLNGNPHDSIICPVCDSFSWTEPDPHSLTAKRVYPECFNMELGEIKSKYGSTLRQDAKIIQFTILYGGSAYTLASRLYKSNSKAAVDKAQKIIDNYYANNPNLKEAMEHLIEEAKITGYIETRGGYRRHLPDLNATQFKAPKRPVLEPQYTKCYSRCDLDWDYSQPASERASYMTCPMLDRDSLRNNCPHFSTCKAAFKAANGKKLVARAERQCFNADVQGSSADIMEEGLLKFSKARAYNKQNNPVWKEVKLISSIYDACYMYAPTHMFKPVKEVVYETVPNGYTGLYIPHALDFQPAALSWDKIH